MKDFMDFFNIGIYINNLLAASYLRSYLQRAGYSKVHLCLNESRFKSLLEKGNKSPHILFVDYEIMHKKGPSAFLSFLFKISPATHIVALVSPPFFKEAIRNLDHGLNDVLLFPDIYERGGGHGKEPEQETQETQELQEVKEAQEAQEEKSAENSQLDLKGLDRMILSKVDQYCQQCALQKEQQTYVEQLQKQSLDIAHSVAPMDSLLAFKQKLEKAKTPHQLIQTFLGHSFSEFPDPDPGPDPVPSPPPVTSADESASSMREGAQEAQEAQKVPESQGGERQILFFHFLPSVYSFVLSHLFPLKEEDGKDWEDMSLGLEGEAFSLSSHEIRTLMQDPYQDQPLLPSLEKFLEKHFPGRGFVTKPLTLYRGQLEGLFVQLGLESMPFTRDLFFLFRDQYELLHLRKKNLDLKLQDELTQLYTRDSFIKKIEEELSRARRITLSCSLVLFSIDQKKLITRELSQAYADFILKCMGKIIKTSSRLNDILFRLGPVDFALLLPHTPQEGAALRAERLRCQLIHGVLGRQMQSLSLSFGVSEFPSCCHSGDVLVKMAQLALKEAQKKGDIKVCIAKAPKDFQPEFKPL